MVCKTVKEKAKIEEYVPEHNLYSHFWCKVHTDFCVQNLSYSSADQVIMLVP
jgi:hypothetical protein